VSFHLGAEISTIEMEASLNPDQLREAELRANQVLFENRPVSVSFHEPGEEAGLRRAIERPGVLRVVSIDSLDRCACGGTHVRSTGEIGAILLGKTEKIRGNLRVEFLCGMRAVRRARADLDALSKIARVLSCGVDESPALVANQLERLQESEKAHRRAVLELAEAHGREAWARATPAASGARRGFKAVESGPITDELRAFAQSFTTGSRSVFIVTTNRPPSILLAVSADFGRNAGALLKTALTAVNGRGGGGATLAQGSVATSELLAQVVAAIESALGD
jgi:alanyl-tRNA synthetase